MSNDELNPESGEDEIDDGITELNLYSLDIDPDFAEMDFRPLNVIDQDEDPKEVVTEGANDPIDAPSVPVDGEPKKSSGHPSSSGKKTTNGADALLA